LTADPTNVFATSPQVTGKIDAADCAVPSPSNLTTAIGDMQLAFTDAAGHAPGVYRWGTGLLIPTDVTLDGQVTDVWIFQIDASTVVEPAP